MHLGFIKEQRGLPRVITCDGRTEDTSQEIFFGSKETGEKLRFIQSGNPLKTTLLKILMFNLGMSIQATIGLDNGRSPMGDCAMAATLQTCQTA